MLLNICIYSLKNNNSQLIISYKSQMIIGLIILLLVGTTINKPIPKLNAALSTFVVNNEIAKNLGPLIEQTILNTNITQNFTESITEYGLTFEATISDIQLQVLDILWKQNILVVNSEYDFNINAKNINITLSTKIVGHESIRKINTTATLILTGIQLSLGLQFINSKSQVGAGFAIFIKRVEIDENKISVQVINDKLDQRIINLVIKLAKSSLNPILNTIIQSKVNPLIADQMSQRAFISIPLGKYLYQIDINTTEVPFFVNKSYLSTPINIQITNLITSSVNPEEENEQLPVKVFNNVHDAEVIISSALINSIVWLVQDSQIIDVYLNNTGLGKDPPINLNTTDLTILMPELPLKTGKNKGVYVHITSSTKVPEVYIRGGRLIASLSVNIEFIVDNTNNYPNNNITQCISQQNCISATKLNTSILASVAIKTDDKNNLFGNLQVIKIQQIKTYQDSYINVNCENLKTILNSLVGSFLPPVNFQLREGMPIPFGMIYGYNVTNVQIKTELDHLAAGLIFDFS